MRAWIAGLVAVLIMPACGNHSAEARRSICAAGSRMLQQIDTKSDLGDVADEIATISGEEPKLSKSEHDLRAASRNIVLRYQQRQVSGGTDNTPVLEAAQRIAFACATP
ncbi:MAG: hypothetical protein ABR548_10825 [Actinomycetota bacterium]|nr:hypothetical protein [Actinomycetota bacterium]